MHRREVPLPARHGQSSVTWRARPGAVGRAVLAQSHVLAAVPAVPLGVAVAETAWPMIAALGPVALLCLAGAPVARRVGPPRDLRQLEAVVTFVLLFLMVAALHVPAYMALGMGPLDAAFESVSAITSTGLSVAQDTMAWPLSGHFLRAWMQWAGGFAIAVAGVALILGPGSTARKMAGAGIDERDILTSTRKQARSLLAVYAAITGLAILAFVFLFPTWWEGTVIALAAVSTGGFTPRADSLAGYSTAAQAAVMLVCVSTTFSLLAYVVARRKGLPAALAETNALAVLALCAGGTAVVAGLKWALGSSAAGTIDSAMNFVSGLTTAGFMVAPTDDAPAVLALIVAGMVIGGGTGSTAGGVKVDRVATLARTVRLSLTRLRAPAPAVTTLTRGGRRVGGAQIVSLAAVLFLYVWTVFAVWLLFLALGEAPLPALFDVVSAVSTVGLTTGVTGPDLPPLLKAGLICAMLLGRLEFLALIATLSPRTWIRKA